MISGSLLETDIKIEPISHPTIIGEICAEGKLAHKDSFFVKIISLIFVLYSKSCKKQNDT